jgi:hypothetical protein
VATLADRFQDVLAIELSVHADAINPNEVLG